MDGWNTTFLLGRPIFRGYVSFREVNLMRGVIFTTTYSLLFTIHCTNTRVHNRVSVPRVWLSYLNFCHACIAKWHEIQHSYRRGIENWLKRCFPWRFLHGDVCFFLFFLNGKLLLPEKKQKTFVRDSPWTHNIHRTWILRLTQSIHANS